MSLRSLLLGLVAAALAGISLCALRYASLTRKLHEEERRLTEARSELGGLKTYADAVVSYQAKKEELQTRIDVINHVKQTQTGPWWQLHVMTLALAEPGVRVDAAGITDKLAMHVEADSADRLARLRREVEALEFTRDEVVSAGPGLEPKRFDVLWHPVFDSAPGDAHWQIHLARKSS